MPGRCYAEAGKKWPGTGAAQRVPRCFPWYLRIFDSFNAGNPDSSPLLRLTCALGDMESGAPKSATSTEIVMPTRERVCGGAGSIVTSTSISAHKPMKDAQPGGFEETSCLTHYSFPSLPPGCAARVLRAELWLHTLGFLGPRDLASMETTCRSLRFLPADNSLWHTLTIRQFPSPLPALRSPEATLAANAAARGAEDARAASRNWKAEFQWRRAKEERQKAYQRALMYGRVGRVAPLPRRDDRPGFDFFEFAARAAATGAVTVPLQVGSHAQRHGSASEEEQSRCVLTAEQGVAGLRPMESVAGESTSDSLSLRQGAAPWSALSGHRE